MELILENPSLLKKSIDIISEIVLEGTIVVKKDYLELVALNSSNVVMVIFRLLSTNFEKYDVEKEEFITVNFEHLNDTLKRCSDREKLVIKLKDNKLKLISMSKNPKEFEISLIEFMDENIQKVPSLSFPVKILMSSSLLSEAINDLSFVEEGIEFIVKDSEFMLIGKTPTRSGKIVFKEEVDISTEEDKEYCCSYTVEYLKKFIKGDKIVKNVELAFNNDYPLKVEYKILDRLLLSFILAPRGED